MSWRPRHRGNALRKFADVVCVACADAPSRHHFTVYLGIHTSAPVVDTPVTAIAVVEVDHRTRQQGRQVVLLSLIGSQRPIERAAAPLALDARLDIDASRGPEHGFRRAL